MEQALLLRFDPLVPWWVIATLGAVCLLLVALVLIRRARGGLLRLAAALVVLAAIANPLLIREDRLPIPDVAVVVVDESPSQMTGSRREATAAILQRLEAALEGAEALETRIVRTSTARADETRLFETLDTALADVPRRRLAGIVLVTDGQVHDVPSDLSRVGDFGPVHTLLTGARDEMDRRISLPSAPSFGVVDEPVQVGVRVDDDDPIASTARVEIRRDGELIGTVDMPIGRTVDVDLDLVHGGETVFEFEVEPGRSELSLANNSAGLVINGVRDRLRVLLISGEPHPGERTWRTLLKSDPSVDLVHFTILRPPEKQDATPITELSLISFPIRELFEIRLADFDLVIFDRYVRRGVLPTLYLQNIAEYVRNGGAFLEASGPNFATELGLYRTPLGDILPGAPTGRVIEQPFRPELTELGLRHPVTARLLPPELVAARENGLGGEPPWGRWFRLIEVEAMSGSTVMSGAEGRPLLMLERIGEGRVAQLASDHAWLWTRGYEGGGPQAELLRRLAHWLMQEPELEEEILRAHTSGLSILVERRSLEDGPFEVEMTGPDGEQRQIPLQEALPGVWRATTTVDEPGLYRLEDGAARAVAVVGRLNPPEFADLRTTASILQPVADATGAGVFWAAMDGVPSVRRIAAGDPAHGRDWMGLVANGDYTVTGVSERSLAPGLAVLLLGLGLALAAWRREGA